MRQRSLVLKASGTNAHLIQYLIQDAQILEDLTTSHKKQIQTIQLFQSEYSNDVWRVTYEQPSKDIERQIGDIQRAVKVFDESVQQEITVLSETSRNIIQLVYLEHDSPRITLIRNQEFSLTAINEAQKSTSTNRSLKRLSWVTVCEA